MKKTLRIVIILLAAALALGAAALAVDVSSAAAGTEEDPLVTLSYLNEVFTTRVTELFHQELEEKQEALQGALEERVSALEALEPGEGGSADYVVETLYDGQTLVCQRGAELLLRVGEASVLASDTPGLVDTSTTGELNDGEALVKNHLYMVTINGHGVRASGTVKIVVRGSYTIS